MSQQELKIPPVAPGTRVVVETTGLAEEIAKLVPQDQAALMAAIEKIPARAKIISCDLEHETVMGMPVIKHIEFNYE
jgi:hypothetical protein|tara:strand:- start:1192 stop:1422 length:231 start_codon:yes stop_codon:yes gene_type:complete